MSDEQSWRFDDFECAMVEGTQGAEVELQECEDSVNDEQMDSTNLTGPDHSVSQTSASELSLFDDSQYTIVQELQPDEKLAAMPLGSLAKLRQNAAKAADTVCLEVYVLGQTALAAVVVLAEVGLDATESAAAGCIVVASIPITMLATFPLLIGSGVLVTASALSTCERHVQVGVLAGSAFAFGGIAFGLAQATSPLLATMGLLNATWNLALPYTSAAAAAVSLSALAGTVKHARAGDGVLPLVRSATREEDAALMLGVGMMVGTAIFAPQALALALPQKHAAVVHLLSTILPRLIETASIAFTTGLWFSPAATLQAAGYTAGSIAGGLGVALFSISLGARFNEEAKSWQAPAQRASHRVDLSNTTSDGVLNRVLTAASRTPEAILGIADMTELDRQVVERAYKDSALKVHPDKWRDESDKARAGKAFVRLNNARDELLSRVAGRGQ